MSEHHGSAQDGSEPLEGPTHGPAVEGMAGGTGARTGAHESARTRAPGRDRRGSDRAARVLGFSSVALAVTVGISTATAVGLAPSAAASELPAFGDCSAFTRHMQKIAEPEVGPYGLGGGGGYGGPAVLRAEGAPAVDAATPQSAPKAGAAPAAAVGNGPTGTNVQERGVDEPDVAKIDGTRVVSLTNGILTVVDASGSKPKLAGSLRFPKNQYPTEMFVLDSHRALVLGTSWEEQPVYDRPTAADAAPAGKLAPGYYRPSQPKVVLTLVDMADAAKPYVVRSEKISGSYISARLTDDTVRMVFTSQPRIAWSYPRENEPAAAAEARNRAAVRNAKAADWLPLRQIFNKAGKLVSEAPLLGCKSMRHPVRPSGVGILSVLTIDTRKGGQALDTARGSGVVGNGDLVYSSPDRLYVATTEGGWNRPWTGANGIRRESQEQRTKIHAFDVSGRQYSPYVGTGTVPGYLFGRWALSEHKGYLRVATTTGPPWAPQDGGQVSQSSVIVLAERGDRLVKVGSVSGLGKTERIRAVRWFDDLAAIVTFRQTDPLYMLDISDPKAPKVKGELKIPGYSAYLHPVGGDRLLGVGQDADSEGRVTGLQVSSFDISNPSKPTRTDAVGLGRGWTDVEHDSRAFTYLPNRRMAIIPAWVMQKVSCPPNAQCMASNEDSPGFAGEIQVPAATSVVVDENGNLKRKGRFIGDSPVLRVLPIGDRLVAITQTSVVLLDPDGLKPTGSVRVAPEYGSNGNIKPMR